VGGGHGKVKIVFFGTPEVAVPALSALLEAGHDLPLVVTQPDRPVGRSRTPVASAIKRFALSAGLTVEQPLKVRTRTFREQIAAHEPDLLVVVAFGRLLSSRLLDQTPRGAINLHFSLLPKYRGAAPVQWALARSEAVTGVTTMRVDARLDAGDVLLREEVAIEQGEHAPALFARLAAVGAPLLVESVAGLAAGSIEPVSQDDAEATLAPLLKREDGWVDPAELDATAIDGRIRGFDPWPGVWVLRGARRLRLVRASVEAPGDGLSVAGELTATADGGVVLNCADGTALRLHEVQPDGRGPLGVADAINGRQIAVGERLEPVRPG